MNVTSLTKCPKHIGIETFTFTMIADIVIALLLAMAMSDQSDPREEGFILAHKFRGLTHGCLIPCTWAECHNSGNTAKDLPNPHGRQEAGRQGTGWDQGMIELQRPTSN